MPHTSNYPKRVASGELLRILGLAFGLAVVLGGTIGVGILRTPGAVVAQLGDGRLAILIWIIGGVYALLGASALADIVTTIPRSGGFYVFAREVLGEGAGFVIGWADWFASCTALTYSAITFSEYLGLLYPDLALLAPAPGALLIISVTLLQLGGMRLSSRVQEVTSFAKALAFLMLVGVLFTAAPAPDNALAGGNVHRVASFAAVVIALQLVVGAYDGWQGAMYFAGEDTAPSRNLPRALIGGVAVVIVVYLLVNAAMLRVLPIDTLAASALPAADAAQVVLGTSGRVAIAWLAALSLVPLVSALLMTTPRVLYAMSRDGLLPPAVGSTTRHGTPAVALVITALAALALLVVRTFDLISAVMAFFAVTGYAGTFVALLVLRHRQPDRPRPFRSWGYPGTTVAVLAGAISLLIGLMVSAPQASAIALAVMAASYPVFMLTRRRTRT